MPSTTLPEVDRFEAVEPTKEPIDFVHLHQIDLSTFDDGAAARKTLAEQVRRAMTTQGFFTLVNHGISHDEMTRQVDIGNTIFNRTTHEEKLRLAAPIRERGEYFGFKPKGLWRVAGQARDKIENFNVYRNLDAHEQPEAFEPYRQETQRIIDITHKDILYKVLRLFAIALQIDDEMFFVNLHDYDREDISWYRWMKYFDEHEENGTGKTVWLQGHQDLTSLSLLFTQPMTALQVRDIDDNAEWKYVSYVPGSIIVNAGEVMQWFTGGYFKAAIHRVVGPPADQAGHDRCGTFYFVLPNSDVVINTVLEQSPVLREAQVARAHEPEMAPTSDEWARGRIMITGKKTAAQGEGKRVERVGKVTTTWFN